MSASGLGRRYAKALLELATERQQVDGVLKELRDVSDAWEASAELRQLVRDPALSRQAVKNTVVALFNRIGVSSLVKNVACLLADRGRLHYLPEVIAAFEELAMMQAGRVRAEVTTARSMPDAYFSELKSKLEQITGNQVVLVKKEDPKLIAGVVTRVGDRIFDGSIRNQLDELKEHLLSQDA